MIFFSVALLPVENSFAGLRLMASQVENGFAGLRLGASQVENGFVGLRLGASQSGNSFAGFVVIALRQEGRVAALSVGVMCRQEGADRIQEAKG